DAANWTTAYNTVTASSTFWDQAYSWGDHSQAGYLTSFTELDPVFGASAAFGISGGDITHWNAVYNAVNASSSQWGTAYTLANLLNSASSTWNAAYASTTALTPSYIRGLFSAGTGLSYSNGQFTNTGVTSIGGLTGAVSTSSLGITSSQWTTSGSNIYYNTGSVSIGTTSASSVLNVVGTSTVTGTLQVATLTGLPASNLLITTPMVSGTGKIVQVAGGDGTAFGGDVYISGGNGNFGGSTGGSVYIYPGNGYNAGDR